VFLGAQPSMRTRSPDQTVVSLRAFNDDAPLVPASFPLRLEQIRFTRGTPRTRTWSSSCAIATTPALPTGAGALSARAR